MSTDVTDAKPSDYLDKQNNWAWSVDGNKAVIITRHNGHRHELDVTKVPVDEMSKSPDPILGNIHDHTDHIYDDGTRRPSKFESKNKNNSKVGKDGDKKADHISDMRASIKSSSNTGSAKGQHSQSGKSAGSFGKAASTGAKGGHGSSGKSGGGHGGTGGTGGGHGGTGGTGGGHGGTGGGHGGTGGGHGGTGGTGGGHGGTGGTGGGHGGGGTGGGHGGGGSGGGHGGH